MNRKESIRILAGLSMLALPGSSEAAKRPKRKYRIAHITDTHVQPEGDSFTHTRKCLERIMKLKDKPDVIFHTGDVIMDALSKPLERVERQWEVWESIIRDLRIPIKYCLGNHDVWGFRDATEHTLYGKKYPVNRLGLPGRYHKFSDAGWHFIFLDSTQPVNGGWYTAYVDEEQYAWLESELANIPRDEPVLLASHIPLLSVSIFELSKFESDIFNVSGSRMHSDSGRLRALFQNYPNVKLCISGHLHLIDNVQYDNVSYLGCGAVSASWWINDMFFKSKAGFALLDLYQDGSFTRQYVTCEWGHGYASHTSIK